MTEPRELTKDQLEGYNGYSKTERDRNFDELKARLADKRLAPAAGPCGICRDAQPKGPFEYHNEDYGMDPFLDTEPALISLCRHCHRDKLHKRFENPELWTAFLAHVRRGGYARDLVDHPDVKREFAAYRAAIARGGLEAVRLRQLAGRNYDRVVGSEWFANLRMDAESKWDPAARPRP